MSNPKIRTQLHLTTFLRGEFKKTIADLADLSNERLLTQFSNPEAEADAYGEQMLDKLGQKHGGPDADYGDLAEIAYFALVDRHDLILLMKYRTLCSVISMLCQVWEQQLMIFILAEADHERVMYQEKDIKRGFEFSKSIFKAHGIEFHTQNSWPVLNEMRLLVNVIKHAEGDSEKKLRVINPKYFNVSTTSIGDFDYLKRYRSTLVQETLLIGESDYFRFVDAVKSFWDELPEHMYSK